MAEVSLTKVCKSYGAVVAVSDFNLEIAEGEFVVLVGPSGCGKSTTLRMIAGLEDITSGEVRIGERVVNQLPPKDRDIAMVFQNYALYQHMTVYDNLAFGLRNRKLPEAEIRTQIDWASTMLGIDALMERRPRQLSGGQQQRVALGRCLVRNPSLFLFDEPLSNLDAKLRAMMRLELKELRTRVPTTSIYVTHDQVEAMTLGDRIVVMKDSFVQQIGTPLELYRRPANLFVAGFMGSPSMNLVEVRLADGAAGPLLQGFGRDIALPERIAEHLAGQPDRRLVMGIRPEHLSLGPLETDGVGFEARVIVTEQLGAQQVLDVRVGETQVIVAGVDPDLGIAGGAQARFAVPFERLHFFAADDAGQVLWSGTAAEARLRQVS